jgi:Plasmid pRiA4b ORF-3-like protein
MIEAIQIKISLDSTSPVIWREMLIPKNISFYKFHHMIQIAMGWTNSHLFEFNIEGYRVGEIFGNMEELDDDKVIDGKIAKLIDLVNEPGEIFKYWYDFGDSWMHTITIVKYISLENTHQLPFCIGGELKCPPEDCGGISGFYDFLSIMSNAKHKEYKEMKQWFGGKFNPVELDLIKINKKLKNIDRYI